jgi:hypothetical protein
MRIVWWVKSFFRSLGDSSASKPRKLHDLRPGDLL